nr:hypothetical protein [Pararhodospirillum photometricum]
MADPKGNAVSCVLTMGRPFGTGRMLGDQGFLAASSELGGGEPLAALLVINTNSKEFHAGIAGAGAQAPAGVSAAAQGLLDRKEAPDAALAHAVKAGPAHVNVASCPEGIPPHPQSCQIGVDPRGAGYGLRSGT